MYKIMSRNGLEILTKLGRPNSRFATVTAQQSVTLHILRRQWSEAHRPLGPHSGPQVGK